jgi:hypothetical protein
MRRDKFKWLWILALVLLCCILITQCDEGRKLKAEARQTAETLRLNQAEIDLIMTRLDGLADDCIVKREWYGFSCREIKTGKLFRMTK